MTLGTSKLTQNLAKAICIGTIAGTFAGLTGCAATQTMIGKRNLDTETKMSSTIFLQPVAPKEKTVFVSIHNTSGKSNLKIKPEIESIIKGDGYKVTNDPTKAHYLLQANILKVEKSDAAHAKAALAGGYNGTLTGAVAGAGAGALIGDSGASTLAGGLVGGIVGTVADSLVKDNFFTMITDVQISERAGKGSRVVSHSENVLQQGTSGGEVVTSSGSSKWLKYRTRIVSTAEKANLTLAEATPRLSTELAKSIAGIF